MNVWRFPQKEEEHHLSWTPGDMFINQQGKCLQLGLSRLGKFSLVGSAKVQLGVGQVPTGWFQLRLRRCSFKRALEMEGVNWGVSEWEKNPMNNEWTPGNQVSNMFKPMPMVFGNHGDIHREKF